MTEAALSLTPQQVDDLQDLVTQIGTSVALGLLPFVGQAIDKGPCSTASQRGHEAAGEGHPAPGQSPPTARKDTAQQPPPHQQGNADAHVGKNGKPNPVPAQRGTMNSSQIGQAAFNQLQESLGEHVADYHCHNDLGWGARHGSRARHDNGELSAAKLSDGQKLRQLGLTPEIRGVGIDAVWHPKSPKPYAITEYKARAVPMTANGMRGLLVSEAAQDKTQQPVKRKERSTYRRSQKPGPSTLPQPATLPQGVPKMSHLWITQRIKSVKGLADTIVEQLRNRDLYMRLVVVVITTVGDGLVHSQQMLGGQMDEDKHASHAGGVTVYGESDRVFTEVSTETEKPSSKPAPENDRSRKQRQSK